MAVPMYMYIYNIMCNIHCTAGTCKYMYAVHVLYARFVMGWGALAEFSGDSDYRLERLDQRLPEYRYISDVFFEFCPSRADVLLV